MKKNKIIAVIPARGGSKRLPRKNIYPVAGKPMIQWVIEAAQGVTEIDQVIVSTDDDEIAAIAKKLSTYVVRRPARLATDECLTEPVITHAVTKFERNEMNSEKVETVVWLNASIPEILTVDITLALKQFKEDNLREVVTLDGRHGVCTSAVRVLKRSALDEHMLSYNVGVIQLDYVDIHTLDDVETVEERICFWRSCDDM